MNYSYLIPLMTWSYSRLKSFENCKYGFLLRYINGQQGTKHFYSEYGTLMHKILEEYYKNKTDKSILLVMYISEFPFLPRDVKGDIREKYFEQGYEYINSLSETAERIIGVEKEINFKIGEFPFVGYIDLVSEDINGVIIQDNKTRILKAKSPVESNKKPRKNDVEFDKYAQQLYLYCEGYNQMFGRIPNTIRFNCFRDGSEPSETVSEEKISVAKEWALSVIEDIKNEEEWSPTIDWFKCKFICDFSETCEYAQLL